LFFRKSAFICGEGLLLFSVPLCLCGEKLPVGHGSELIRTNPWRYLVQRHYWNGVKQVLLLGPKIGFPGETGGETSRLPGGFDITGVLFLVRLSSQGTTLWLVSPPAMTKQAPRNWERKNVELVIATKVIDGSPGPPRVVAAHFW